jgi:membrane associated rhomboid family serine protease
MLQDRSYMRDGYPVRRTGVLTWLICSIVAAFVLQNVFARWFGVGAAFEHAFGLSPDGIRLGRVWTLLTYGFLHSTDNLLQILGYLLVLYFVGRELLPLLGTRRFLGLYFAALALGGALWTAVHWRQGGVLIGASAGVTALFIVYACFYPEREISLVLFFFLPVSLKPKHIAFALIGIDLLGFAFYEALGSPSPFGIAHSAHLGGMAAGWLYFRFVHDCPWELPARAGDIELPRWMKRGPAAAKAAPAFRVNVGSRPDLRAEVDRILDKINSNGFGSLSAEEKRLLDEARDSISRR